MENITDLSALFSTDLTNVDISLPLIADKSTCVLRITDLKVVDSKAGNSKMLKFDLATEHDVKDSKGAMHPAGFFKMFHRVGITATEEYTSERIAQELKKIMSACGRTGAFGDPASYIGELVTAMVVIEKDKNGTFPDSNRVKYFIAKK